MKTWTRRTVHHHPTIPVDQRPHHNHEPNQLTIIQQPVQQMQIVPRPVFQLVGQCRLHQTVACSSLIIMNVKRPGLIQERDVLVRCQAKHGHQKMIWVRYRRAGRSGFIPMDVYSSLITVSFNRSN